MRRRNLIPRNESVLLAYAGAVGVTALAIGLRWLLDPVLGDHSPFVTLFGAVALSVWLGGTGPGVLATVVSLLAANYLFIEPRGILSVKGWDHVAGAFAYLLSCLIIIAFGATMRAAQRRAEAHVAEALDNQKALEREALQREQAQAALDAAYRKVTTILESITDAFYALDRAWRFTFINVQAERYYGRPKETMLGKVVWELFPEKLQTAFHEQYHRAVAEGVAVHFEVQSPATGRWVDVHAYPSLDGLSVYFRDITEDREIREAVRQRAEELETLMDILPVGVWVGDANGERITGNRAAYEMLRLPAGESVSLTAPESHAPAPLGFKYCVDGREIPPEDLPMRRVADTGAPLRNFEHDLVFDDGMVKAIYGSAAPLFDKQGRVRAVIAAQADITARKQVEAALRRREREFARLVENLPDVVFRLDGALRHTYISPVVGRFTGLLPQQCLGKTGREVGLPPEACDVFEAHCREVFTSGEESQVEFGHGGRQFRTRLIPERASDGSVQALLGITEDITERKQAERLKNELISIVSHELRTPLTSIAGALGLINGGALGPLPARVKEMVEIAYRNSDRLTRLINDMLDLDKIESGNMPFSPQPVELRQAVEEALAAHQPHAEQQGVALVLDPGTQEVQVYADPDRLQQVLANLLSNAIKFSPSGESVEARVRPAADRVRVEVVDRGSGIPEEFRDRIFQKFTQADSARGKGGTGLGLSIAKGIIERSGGYLGFESAVGQGTTFYFELPCWSERLTA